MDLIRADEALSLKGVVQKDGRHIQEKDLGFIKKPVLLRDKSQILFVGTETEFNSYYKKNKDVFAPKSKSKSKLKSQNKSKNFKSKTKSLSDFNLESKTAIKEIYHTGTLLPGFVESHTHLVFAGDRKHEFEMRNQGKSYQQIAEAGGGIKFTMEQTKKISKQELLKISQHRLNEFKKQGVVLLESKSGYGPDLKTELKILEINDALKGVEIVSTFLGLHAVQGDKSSYVNDVVSKFLPEVHKKTKSRHADIFMDKGYFDDQDLNSLVEQVKKHSWSFTAHTDQLGSTGAGLKASKLGALSISHCVNMTSEEIQNVASSSTVFNLLPAADFYLKIKYPKAREMIDSGGKVSLATDFNPGSSPTQNINFTGVLARLEMKMTLPEVIAAYTYNAASALGRQASLSLNHQTMPSSKSSRRKTYGALISGASSKIQMISDSWTDLFYQV